MAYRISAADATGAIALERTTAAGALKKARELEAAGFRNVRIVDPDDREHEVATFAEQLAAQPA
ncbi:hypothetical protein [Stella sp.]|uniref:hypothetical protein n=1 Tax=Stella sp. TaxID=2912054 RepID=UPI0035B38452